MNTAEGSYPAVHCIDRALPKQHREHRQSTPIREPWAMNTEQFSSQYHLNLRKACMVHVPSSHITSFMYTESDFLVSSTRSLGIFPFCHSPLKHPAKPRPSYSITQQQVGNFDLEIFQILLTNAVNDYYGST